MNEENTKYFVTVFLIIALCIMGVLSIVFTPQENKNTLLFSTENLIITDNNFGLMMEFSEDYTYFYKNNQLLAKEQWLIKENNNNNNILTPITTNIIHDSNKEVLKSMHYKHYLLIETMHFKENISNIEDFPENYTIYFEADNQDNHTLIWELKNISNNNYEYGTYHNCQYTFGNLKVDLKEDCNKLNYVTILSDSATFYFYETNGTQNYNLGFYDPEKLKQKNYILYINSYFISKKLNYSVETKKALKKPLQQIYYYNNNNDNKEKKYNIKKSIKYKDKDLYGEDFYNLISIKTSLSYGEQIYDVTNLFDEEQNMSIFTGRIFKNLKSTDTNSLNISLLLNESYINQDTNETKYKWNEYIISNQTIMPNETKRMKITATWDIKIGDNARDYLPQIIIPKKYTEDNKEDVIIEAENMTWFNQSWNYKKEISITTSNNRNDYALPITINFSTEYTNSKINRTCQDIRFADTTELIELNYWIQNCSLDLYDNAIFYVKSNYTTENNSIYVYYGNDAVTNTSDGEATFIFYDDFEGTTLNSSKWTNGANILAINNSILTHTAFNSSYDEGLQSIETFSPQNKALIFRTNYSTGYGIIAMYNSIPYTDDGESLFTAGPASEPRLYTWNEGTRQDTYTLGMQHDEFNIHELRTNSSSVSWYYQGVYNTTHATQVPDDSDLKITINGYNDSDGVVDIFQIDYIFLRDWYAIEPSYSIGSEEIDDIVIPTIYLYSPTATIYDSTNVTLNYSTSDENLDTTWYEYNNDNTTITENTSFTALDNQQSTIILWANDTKGNISSESVTFTVDTIIPYVEIYAPINTTYYFSISLDYTSLDTNLDTTWYEYNNTNTTLTGNTSFVATEGQSTLILWANDSVGNINSTSVIFTKDVSISSYKKIINITTSTNRTDYALKIIVDNVSEKMNHLYSDLRFNKSDNTFEYPYWINLNNTNETSAEIYIKGNFTNTTQIYMYYGDSEAVSEADGEATFIFFDEFNDASINSSKWSSGNHNITESGGLLTVIGTQEDWDEGLKSIEEFSMNNRSITAYARTVSGYAGFGLWDSTWLDNDGLFFYNLLEANENNRFRTGNGGTSYSIDKAKLNYANYYKFELTLNDTSGTLYVDDVYDRNSTTYLPDEGMNITIFANEFDDGDLDEIKVSWIFLRDWYADEPIYVFGDEEEVITPTFSITLNSPENNYETMDTTPTFNFSISGENNSYSCELLLDEVGYGINETTLNGTNTLITANASLGDNTYSWKIECTNETTETSASRNIIINNSLYLTYSELYPETLYTNKNLTSYCSCIGGGTLKCYVQMYKDDEIFGVVNEYSVVSGANTSFYNLSSLSTTKNDEWISEIWCGNETTNTTHENTTTRTILNSEPYCTLNSPANNETNVSTTINLNVTCIDIDNDTMNISYYGKNNSGTTSENFTIIVLPDTQHYSELYPAIYTNQTQWIVNNVDILNIQHVLHVGDVVQNPGTSAEWDNANTSMSLLDGVVPYGIAIGNHDMLSVPDGDSTNFNNYFGYSRYQAYDWFGSYYDTNVDSHYNLQKIGEDYYIYIFLEFYPSDAMNQWANETLQLYSNRSAIIINHMFLHPDASRYDIGQKIWDDVIVHNPNVFMVLCGHVANESRRTDNSNSTNVHQIMANYQFMEDGLTMAVNGGNGYLRIMKFAPIEDKVYVQSYSPYLDDYETNDSQQFVLDVNLTGVTGSEYELIGTVNDTTNNTSTIYSWSDLSANTQYLWYVNVTDGDITNKSDIFNFTTTAETDTTNPYVNLYAPLNTTYSNTNITLNYTSSDTNLDTTWYEYDSTNTTLTINTSFTATEGQSTIILWANDTIGNINSTSIVFTVDTTPPTISNYYQLNSTNNTVDFGLWTEGFVSINWNLTNTSDINTSSCQIRVRNKDNINNYTNLSFINESIHPDYDPVTGYKILTCYTEDLGNIIKVSANMTRSYDWRPMTISFDQDSATHDNAFNNFGNRATKMIFHNISNTINTTFIFLADVVNQSGTVADLLFYSCNSSYTTGDFTVSPYCALVGTAHPNASRDINFNYLIGALTTDENGTFGGVVHTETMYGISYCPSCTNTNNAWQTYSTNGYEGHSATSVNQGAGWSDLSGSEFNVILHVIDNTQLEFNLTIKDNSGNELSDLQIDTYGALENLAPFGDIISDSITGDLVSYYDIHNITETGTIWINVTISDPNADIMNCSIYLLNNDSTLNQTLLENYSIDGYGICSYEWDTTTISDGDYRLNVTATDGLLTGYDESSGYIKIDNAIPTISLYSPGNITYGSTNITLSYTSSDTNLDTTWYEYNSTNTTLTINTSFTATEGQNTIILWANDTIGNINSTSVIFTVDTINPTLNLLNPENTTYASTTVSIVYTSSDTNLDTTWYEYNNTNTTLTGNTIFTASIGQSTFILWANDTAGNYNSESITFTANETTNPYVNLYAPLNTTYSNTNITLNYTSSDTNLDTTWYEYDSTNTTLTINTSFTATEGQNTIILWANDTFGNINQTTILFTVDTTNPYVNLYAPLNTTYSNTNITLNYTSSDTNLDTTWYEYDSTNTTLTENTSFTATEGQSTIILWANDTIGNINSTSIVFTVDTTNPYVNLYAPLNTTYSNTNITLSYTSSDTNLDTTWYEYNSTNTTLTINTSFTATEGQNTIILWANDTADNINSTTILFTIDTTNPLIEYVSPTANNNTNLTVDNTYINLSITEVNQDTIILNWNGTNQTLLNSYIYKTELSNGIYTYYVWINDTAGNTNQTETRTISVYTEEETTGGGGGGAPPPPKPTTNISIIPFLNDEIPKPMKTYGSDCTRYEIENLEAYPSNITFVVGGGIRILMDNNQYDTENMISVDPPSIYLEGNQKKDFEVCILYPSLMSEIFSGTITAEDKVIHVTMNPPKEKKQQIMDFLNEEVYTYGDYTLTTGLAIIIIIIMSFAIMLAFIARPKKYINASRNG